ncbi:alpha-ribazole phosphatase [Chitinophaga qingshengii]|uniref:Alpha-ribazole phosphatase n=1 Tax=Chitinophaga qingshengii TaxID=1569794 RepID=A0ABR7TTM7_9BACT|nr:alpha-ribazole phosphatase [Chitinophaga qingshengii]MBC9933829.1 alpha-ribazole phosphatase [Chitinophaga qingshengii]
MEIYLIRHTTPAIESGVCYGFSDIDVADTFETEVAALKAKLPAGTFDVYTSPLQRCHKLATALFGNDVITDERLKEMNFGAWEMQPWEAIGKEELQTWADDFVLAKVPQGESYEDLYTRSMAMIDEVIVKGNNAVLVTHGGVIRSILAHATNTPLVDSFDLKVQYGRISQLQVENGDIKVIFYNS